jgi:hypothetical protein
MRLHLHRTATVVAAVLAVAGLLAVGGCAANLESQLIGSWETRLVGYNTTAQGVTNYNQTVSFAENGTVTVDTTLPGAVNHVTGTYEVVGGGSKPTLNIKWDMPVDQPTTLYFTIEDGKLLTSPSPGGLAKPQNLNVANADPVVYVRAAGK